MNISELRQKTAKDLLNNLTANREKLQSLRFDMVAGKVKNVREIRSTRKQIAQILTILKEGTNK